MRTSGRIAVFLFLWLLSSAVVWHPFADTVSLALHNNEYTHILLILPVSAALILSEWASLRFNPSWSVKVGLFWFFIGGMVLFSARSWPPAPAVDVRLSLSMLALVILWIGAFVMCFGTRVGRSLLFPLGFLFWLVPIPSFLLVRIVQLLQRESAIAAWLLFLANGVPVARQGVLLSIPGLNLEVARECSSIRTSLMLVVTTMVLAHVLLRTPWRKVLVVLLAVPVSIAKNGLRIFTIGMLTTRVDRSYLNGRLHHDGGIVFFLIALAITLVFVWILRQGERGTVPIPALRPLQS